MRLFLALVLGYWYLSSPALSPLGSIPISQITFDMLFRDLGYSAIFGAAVVSGLWSLKEDRIWPWNWASLAEGGTRILNAAIVLGLAWLSKSLVREPYYSFVVIPLAALACLHWISAKEIEVDRPASAPDKSSDLRQEIGPPVATGTERMARVQRWILIAWISLLVVGWATIWVLGRAKG